MREIKLGEKVRDTVTGFEGIAVARVEYLNGCIQYAVQARVSDDGKLPAVEYFDHQRLELADVAPMKLASSNTGGPQRDTPAGTYRG